MPASPSTSSSASGRSRPASFRFRPRYRLFAYGTALLGAAFTAAPLIGGFTGGARTVALVIGIGGLALGLLYLASPAWRIVVVVDDRGLEVLSSGDRRFYLAWDEIDRVVASPTTRTCFVDGGSPDRSLKVPGKGAPAPYAIEDREALYAAIMARVPAEVVEEVPYLEVEVVE